MKNSLKKINSTINLELSMQGQRNKKEKEKKTILVNFSFRESLILLRYSSVFSVIRLQEKYIYLIKSKKLSND